MREIEEGVVTHPLVQHSWEEHSGVQQDFIMRIVSVHYTYLERQIQESHNIIRPMNTQEECLNLKTEWGGAKIPLLTVFTPKGAVGERLTGGPDLDSTLVRESREALKEALKVSLFFDRCFDHFPTGFWHRFRSRFRCPFCLPPKE